MKLGELKQQYGQGKKADVVDNAIAAAAVFVGIVVGIATMVGK